MGSTSGEGVIEGCGIIDGRLDMFGLDVVKLSKDLSRYGEKLLSSQMKLDRTVEASMNVECSCCVV
jgi:hypothetical protein